jgi:hypothetical protein
MTDRRRAIDVERRDTQPEQTASDLLFDHRAGADGDLVDDQISRSDARGDAIAMRNRLQRVVARHDSVHAHRARRRIGVELSRRPREKTQHLFDRAEVRTLGRRRGSRPAALGRGGLLVSGLLGSG